MLTEIGKVLRIIRMNSGDNAAEMAKKLYMSTSYLYLIENGKRKIPSGFETHIAKAYRISDAERETIRRIIAEEQSGKSDAAGDALPENADDDEVVIDDDFELSEDPESRDDMPTEPKKHDKKTAVIVFEAIAIVLLLVAVIVLTCVITAGKSKLTPDNNTSTSDHTAEIPIEPTPAEMFEYEERGGLLYVTKYIGGDDNVLVPSEIDGKDVYEVAEGAFANNKTVKSVAFSNGIKRLGFHIFESCPNLRYIKVPDSVHFVGSGLGLNCGKLEKVEIGDGATLMGEYAFSGCTGLKSVKIGKNVCQIDHDAFNSCGALTEIELPDTVTAIKYHAFYACTKLRDVVIPDSVTLIEDNAFCFCSSLESVFVPPGVTKIGDNVFGECHKLTVYGNSGSYIEKYCADNGYNFRSLTEETPADKFEYKKEGGNIKITKYIGNEDTVVIPKEIDGKPVTRIGERAFFDNESVKCIVIPTGIQFIGFKAFAECINLEYVSIPDSVTYLDNAAFEHCDSLKTVVIGSSVQTVGQCEFLGCHSLKNVTMNKYIRTIDHNAFAECYALEQIALPERLNEIKYSAFNNCRSLKSVILPSNVASVGDYAFSECASLEYVFIPPSVTTIGKEIFSSSGDVTIYTTAGSYAEKYASENGYKCSVVADVSQIN